MWCDSQKIKVTLDLDFFLVLSLNVQFPLYIIQGELYPPCTIAHGNHIADVAVTTKME